MKKNAEQIFVAHRSTLKEWLSGSSLKRKGMIIEGNLEHKEEKQQGHLDGLVG